MAPIPTWKKVLAFLVDFFGTFFGFGIVVAYFSGDLTSNGFELEGLPALILFGLILAYFVIMNKFLGGTLGKKLFRISQSKPEVKNL